MTNIAKTESPARGLTFTTWSDSKFRSETIWIRLRMKADGRYVQHYQLLADLLTSTTRAFPSRSDMSEETKDLYGALVQSNFSIVGDTAMMRISVSCIADRYTIYGENITDRCADLLLKILFEPNAPDGVFEEREFMLEKNLLGEFIKQSLANRHKYAVKKARMAAFEGEAAGIDTFGELQDVEKITPQEVYEAYRRLLDTAQISVIFCGRGENDSARQLVRSRLTEFAKKRLEEGGAGRIYDKKFFAVPSPIKSEVCEKRERMKQEQLNLEMILKTDGGDRCADRVAVKIFGGSAFSMLFSNVRERLSLCYYCGAQYMEFKSAVLIDCGVEAKNEKRAREEIMRQLDLLKAGEFSDELLENSIKTMADETRGVADNTYAFAAWYEVQSMLGESVDIDEVIAQIRAVTRERVVRAAERMKLDTVFVLEPLGSEQTDAEEGRDE